MPSISDLLARFRPAGTPGPAAPAGVPEDRRAATERELAPVFAELLGTEGDCDALHAAAVAEAARRTDEARRWAEALAADATAKAPAERARSAATVEASTRDELARMLDAARDEAAAVRAQAATRLPGLVDAVTARVREELSSLVTVEPG